MATAKIIWNEGAIYHITTRGNHRENIFKDEADFKVYLSQVEENLKYYSHLNYELIAYCLMTNHVHLMIKTGEEPLTRIMRRLNSKYTIYFNKKYDCVGHLFQGRYFSEIMKDQKQLLETSRYIHLNPVKAKIVNKPEEYKWSSYPMFIEERKERKERKEGMGKTEKMRKLEKVINPTIVLDYFTCKSRYKEFVEALLPLGAKNFQD